MRATRIKQVVFAAILLVLMAQASQAWSVTVYFGRGGCKPGAGICKIVIDLRSADGVMPNADATIEGHNMMLSFNQPIPETALMKRGKKMMLNIEEDVQCAIGKQPGTSFDYRSITVKKGNYIVDYSNNKNGEVTVKATYDLKQNKK